MLLSALYIILFVLSIAWMSSKKVFSLLIFTFFVANGLSILPISSGGVKLSHLSFAYVLVFALRYRRFTIRSIRTNKLAKRLWYLMLFFVVSVAFSITYYGFPVVSTIITGARYFVLMSFFVYMTLRLNEYEKLLRILFYITLGTGILYIAQCITGVQLLAYNLEVYEMPTENGLYRFYNSPPLNEYFLYISLFYPSLLPKKLKLAAPIIFFLVILLSNGRTIIFTSILTIVLIAFLIGKSKKIILSFAFLGVVLFVLQDKVMSRIDNSGKTSDDISLILRGQFNMADYQSKNGYTMLYRFAWIKERWDYLKGKPIELLFGLGLLPDEHPVIQQKYHFKYGLLREDLYVSQVRTPDISWGNFLTCYGLLGTIFFFLFYFQLLRSVRKIHDTLSTILFAMMLTMILSSFAGSQLSEPYSITPLFIFYMYIKKKHEYEKSSCINRDSDIQL